MSYLRTFQVSVFVLHFSFFIFHLSSGYAGNVGSYNFINLPATQSMTIQSIVQSEDGNMWFSSGKTLYEFDGESILTVSSPTLDNTGVINCLHVNDGKMLIGCEHGLVEMKMEGRRFEAVSSLDSHVVRCIIDDAGCEWIGTDKGLYRNRTLVVPDIDILSLTVIGDDILIGSMSGMKIYDVGKRQLTAVPGGEELLATCFAYVGKKEQSRMAAGLVNGIAELSLEGDMPKVVWVKPLPVVKCLVADADGRIVTGCEGGLYEMADSVRLISHDSRDIRSLSGNVVWCMTKDRNGNLWVGTDNGISVLAHSQNFTIFPLSSVTDSGKGNQIYCMLHDSRNRLWLGGTNGIVCIRNWMKASQTHLWYSMTDTLHGIPHNRIRTLYEDPLHGVWACTDGGLLRYDDEDEEWEVHRIDEDERNWVYNVERQADALVVTTFHGVYRCNIDRSTHEITKVRRIDATPDIRNRYVTATIGDDKWTVTPEGMQVSGSRGTDDNTIDLPEKFVSIYYNASDNLVYLGGSDQFAVMVPDAYTSQESTEIWFDPEARIVTEDGRNTGIIVLIGIITVILIAMLILYFVQQRRIRKERARRKALLRGARAKALLLEISLDDLQQKFKTSQIMALGNTDDIDDTDNSDSEFILRVTHMIDDNIDDAGLSVATLSNLMHTSSKQLYRKIKQATGLTAVEYIRKFRMQKAAALLIKGNFTVNEVMYMVGFNNPSYFSRAFTAEYGMPPTEYRNQGTRKS